MEVDALVIGVGVVGIAAARALQLSGRATVLVEREARFGTGVSARNSKVIHAGIYYPPGSLKARRCVEGRHRLYAYCAERRVAHRRLGKLIVAVADAEVATLHAYRGKAEANGVGCLDLLDARQVRDLEPEVRGVAALMSPDTGIIDSRGLMQALLTDFEDAGGLFAPRTAVRAGEVLVDDRIALTLDDADWSVVLARRVVNAAGLHAPQVAGALAGFRAGQVPTPCYAIGHYFQLLGRSPFARLVCPVASAGGLGVHVTLDLAGAARFGPDIAWIDYRFEESRKLTFVDAIRRYYPSLHPDRLVPAHSGIRPKIVGPGQGDAEFLIQGPGSHGVPGIVNLFGIESPGLTASLAIAEHVRDMLR